MYTHMYCFSTFLGEIPGYMPLNMVMRTFLFFVLIVNSLLDLQTHLPENRLCIWLSVIEILIGTSIQPEASAFFNGSLLAQAFSKAMGVICKQNFKLW